MIVVDASAFTQMLVYSQERGKRAREVLGTDLEWSAPEHWKAEVFSAVRGLLLGGHLGEDAASRAIAQIPRMAVDHVGLDTLLPQMWQLREEVSGYDAAYVVLARQRGLTLVTADGRLARTATRYCRVEQVRDTEGKEP